MSDEEENGLFNINLSDEEQETAAEKKAKRTGQTEEEFQAVRKDYVAKIQNGDVSAQPSALFLQYYTIIGNTASPCSRETSTLIFLDL